MSHNVSKPLKQPGTPSPSPTLIPHNKHLSNQFPQPLSLDVCKDRESASLSINTQTYNTTSRTGIKKLAFLLDPRKDRTKTLQDTHSSNMSPVHTSPKSMIDTSAKANKIRLSTSSQNAPDFGMMSPKDLVRLALSKHQSKESMTIASTKSPSSLQRDFRKSLSIRFGSKNGIFNKRDSVTNGISSPLNEQAMVSRASDFTTLDKAAKLRRMKLIYNDSSPTADGGRLTKSTVYTPGYDFSQQMWQGSLSPEKSNSELVWPSSPTPTTGTANNKSKAHLKAIKRMGSLEETTGRTEDDENKSQPSPYLLPQMKPGKKGSKSPLKQNSKRKEKIMNFKKIPSTENLKSSSVPLSRLMSQGTLTHEFNDSPKSPMVGFTNFDEFYDLTRTLEDQEKNQIKEGIPREEFITSLKNWVDDIVKPEDERKLLKKKNKSISGKPKYVEEALLAKIRQMLEKEEYVKREDYDKVVVEKEAAEGELSIVKEENERLKTLVNRLEDENKQMEVKESLESKTLQKPEIKAGRKSISEAPENLKEAVLKQQKELEELKKREGAVRNVLKMILETGIQIEEYKNDVQIKEEEEGEGRNPQTRSQSRRQENEEDNSKVKEIKLQGISQQGNFFQKFQQMQEEHAKKKENKIAEKPCWAKNIQEQVEEEVEDSQLTGHEAAAMSEIKESEEESSIVLFSASVKETPIEAKSTADCSPLFSAKPRVTQNKSREKCALKIDLTGLGGNMSIPKSNVFSSPSESSAEKSPYNNNYMFTEGSQAMGFHDEFMSKLDEFSESWRQLALQSKKF